MYTINMFITFFNEFTTQSKTALSLGTRLIVFNGRNTLSTRSDLMVDKFVPTVPPLKSHVIYIIKVIKYYHLYGTIIILIYRRYVTLFGI